MHISQGDYRQLADRIDGHSFVYLDPPYRPLSASAQFTAYAAGGFDDGEQRRLAAFIDQINGRGARLLLSNSDPKNSDGNDHFFDDLYANYCIRRVPASRLINSRASNRGPVSELLISNFKPGELCDGQS